MRRWCEDAGGSFYARNRTRTTGFYGCDLDEERIEVEQRSRKNDIKLRSKDKGFHPLGLADDADLVYGDEDQHWVETTEATIGTDPKTTGVVMGGPKASKLPLKQKRDEQSSMWKERR